MPTPFDGLQPDPTTHFRLYMLEAVQHVLRQVGASFGSIDTAVEHFPFLRRYCDGFDRVRHIRREARIRCELIVDAGDGRRHDRDRLPR